MSKKSLWSNLLQQHAAAVLAPPPAAPAPVQAPVPPPPPELPAPAECRVCHQPLKGRSCWRCKMAYCDRCPRATESPFLTRCRICEVAEARRIGQAY